MSENFIKIA